VIVERLLWQLMASRATPNPPSQSELAGLRTAADELGADVLPRNMYSPVPAAPAAEHWSTPKELAGLRLDAEAQLAWAERELRAPLAEFDPPREPTGTPGEFHLWNTWYEGPDAQLLWAMVRHLRPRRVLEMGAGYSTLVTAAACAANERDGDPARFVSVDPEPRMELDQGIEGLSSVEEMSTTELPLERFDEFDSGDVLFVDTSHVVKMGSEVNYLVLEVLPRLRPGVFVHFHDIFLPYEYPRKWFERGAYLSEQYLVQAFLAHNSDYEVVFAAHAVAQAHHRRLAALLCSLDEPRPSDYAGPAAFWIRRVSRSQEPKAWLRLSAWLARARRTARGGAGRPACPPRS
jgi:predicted O-methyltransferase YrrM